MQYKNIYFFRYNNPSTNPPIWDRAPLVIPLDITSKSLLAINLHWIPLRDRRAFVDWLIKNFREGKKFKRLFYNTVKARWPKALVGIRRYHVGRITSMIKIPQEKWDDVLKVRTYKTRKYGRKRKTTYRAPRRR